MYEGLGVLEERVTLYRAVSMAEYRDLQEHRRFQTTPSSLEGKWFATTASDAAAWGRLFERFSGPFTIIAIDVPRGLLQRFGYRESLDGIGPAYYAGIEQLEQLLVDVGGSVHEPG